MLKIKRKAFTMIELVFVIVVLGILAAVAIPKFAATRTDAQIAKGRSDVAAIRSAIISERQVRLIRGESNWISSLHDTTQAAIYFDNNGTAANSLLMYGVTAQNSDGHWHNAINVANGQNLFTYDFMLEGADNTFSYNPTNAAVTVNPGAIVVPPGGFVCTAGARCAELTN